MHLQYYPTHAHAVCISLNGLTPQSKLTMGTC